MSKGAFKGGIKCDSFSFPQLGFFFSTEDKKCSTLYFRSLNDSPRHMTKKALKREEKFNLMPFTQIWKSKGKEHYTLKQNLTKDAIQYVGLKGFKSARKYLG